jgi:integrase
MMQEIQLGNRSLTTPLQELHTLAETHLTNSKADNTKKAYGSDWQLFVQWCEAHSLEALPASPETLVYYLTFLGQTCKASTIKRKMTSISRRHDSMTYASPTKTALVQGVWQGIQRTIGIKENGKEALWLHDLRQIVGVIPPTRIGMRDLALFVLGWAGAFRRSELVALDVEDIRFTRDGLIIQIEKSKTDQQGAGQEVALPYGSNRLTCPVRSLQEWLSASNITSGPIFRRMDRHGNIYDRLTDQSVRLIVQKHCKEVGLPFESFGAHSLRSGFCSSAAKAGKSEHQIMRQTRHKQSSSLQRYIKHGTIFEDNAASGIGL